MDDFRGAGEGMTAQRAQLCSWSRMSTYGSRSRYGFIIFFRKAPPQREGSRHAHHGNHGIKTWPALPARGPSPAREMGGVRR